MSQSLGIFLKALEAVVPVLEVEGEVLKYEAIAVSDVPEDVKKVLKESNLDESIVIGLLTIERASMVPDTITGTLRKVESYII